MFLLLQGLINKKWKCSFGSDFKLSNTGALSSETYLEPGRTPTMESFLENVSKMLQRRCSTGL